jgi:hypothetical protein
MRPGAPTPSDGPTLRQLFPAEGSDREVEFILVEQVGSRAWRIRSRWMGHDMPQSTFALTEATVEDMQEQARVVADQCGLVAHYLPPQPLPFHAPAVLLLTKQ